MPRGDMKSFLIIDDNTVLLDTYELLIRRRYNGASVIKAHNGKEALTMINDLDYSLILSDISMPIMNGIDFHKNLKKESPLLKNKVIFMSGNPDQSDLSYIEKEAIPFLHKPFVKDDFYNLIDSISLMGSGHAN